MFRWFLLYFLAIHSGLAISQVFSTRTELEGQLIGGKDELEQILQTQLTLSKAILTSNFDEEITIFFDLDSLDHAINLRFSKGLNNLLRNELKRITRFMKFRRTQSALYETEPYFLTFRLSTERYNAFFKQRSRLNTKKMMSADSSYIIYTKADKSPEYYKNSEEGLTDFMLSEMEYPKIARERSIEGTVVLEFIVETNGYVTGINAKQHVNGGCTEEAIRIIKQTRWQPALVNNKLVRYKTVYPVTFNLQNTTSDRTSAVGQ